MWHRTIRRRCSTEEILKFAIKHHLSNVLEVTKLYFPEKMLGKREYASEKLSN